MHVCMHAYIHTYIHTEMITRPDHTRPRQRMKIEDEEMNSRFGIDFEKK